MNALLDPMAAPGRTRFRQWLQWARDRLPLYLVLVRADRPAGALLLMWPTLWALWIASAGTPSLHLFLVFVAGVFLTRSAGCVINDLADRDFDPHVERTRGRPLATGAVGTAEAMKVAGALLVAAFLLVLTTNRLAVLLSFAALPLAAAYPYMKRVTYIPQFFLGLAFSWGIPMAFAAATGGVPLVAWLVFIANVLWAMIYDTMYAMVDREDDVRIGVKSTAILFDDADRLIIGIMQGMMLMVLMIVGRQVAAGLYYFAGVAAAAILMLHHQFLIRDRSRDGCFRAFLANNWLGLAIFAGIALDYQVAAR
jgi:4-hydroxybenzoate polyprenyltransferase